MVSASPCAALTLWAGLWHFHLLISVWFMELCSPGHPQTGDGSVIYPHLIVLARWARRLWLSKRLHLEFWLIFLSVNIFSSLFRDEPLQQDFVLMNTSICHPPPSSRHFFPWTLKARWRIETTGGNRWIVDDSASTILLFQDKYSEEMLSLSATVVIWLRSDIHVSQSVCQILL